MDNKARFNKNRTEGDIAERVFAGLINSMEGWQVVPYGVENHIQNLKESLANDFSASALKIKRMPDFILVNKEEKKLMFFEVKRTHFIDKREKGKLLFGFQKGTIAEYLKFWPEAKIFIAHQEDPCFYIIDLKDIIPEKHLERKEYYITFDNAMDRKRPMECWNFKDIKKDISEIFPDLKKDKIEEAKKLIT